MPPMTKACAARVSLSDTAHTAPTPGGVAAHAAAKSRHDPGDRKPPPKRREKTVRKSPQTPTNCQQRSNSQSLLISRHKRRPDQNDHGFGSITLDGQLPESCIHHCLPGGENDGHRDVRGANVVCQMPNNIGPQGNLNIDLKGEIRRQHECLLNG